MIETNLTHLNITLNVSLVEPSPPWWTSLANPATWLPLLIVLIGAYATYFYANQLEKRKNQYDLKVKVYFELLEIIHSLIAHEEKIFSLKREPQDESTLKKYIDLSEQFNEDLDSLSQILPKLEVVCNADVMQAYADFKLFVSKMLESEVDNEIFVNKQLRLTQAIRRDLMSGKEFGPSPWHL